MKCFFIVVLLVVWSVIPNALNTYGQDVKVEKWTGTLKFTDKRPENVTFTVKRSDQHVQVMGMTYIDTFFKCKEQKMAADTLSFSLTPGEMDAHCRLKKQKDGGYSGKCLYTDSDKFLELALRPPQLEE